MTPKQFEQVQHLFLRIYTLSTEKRDRELAKEDDEIRREVESLLAAHESCGAFLDHGLAAYENDSTQSIDSVSHSPAKEGFPKQIGVYRILHQIGEGGHGTVFMAEQLEPIVRKVAIKLIKPGMDSRQVLARFHAERQVLAMMEHPSIARVLEAGATDTGLPYFVMELVIGIPIHDFCEQNDLALCERLKLFLQVCDAVHHAHRKGVIHRDLKPSNVLVTIGEAEPLAKVIDFGIAKALDARLTQQTLFTEYGQMIGTLEYMSPEQAEMSAVDIDTRSDVYSLGVLLYQLLTGDTPISRDILLSKGLLEISRQIRDTEPSTPSSHNTKHHRQLGSTERSKLGRGLTNLPRGELDWITLKSLAKDRRQRYDSAKDFSRDISRFLKGEPVAAHPPSILYKVTKFARRNWLVVMASLLVFASSLLGIIGLSVGFHQAGVALDRAKIDRDAAQQSAQAADRSSRELAENMYAELVCSAWRASESHDLERATELLNACSPEMRGWEWEFVHGRNQSQPHTVLRRTGQSAIDSIAIDTNSSQGTELAACVLENGKVEIWDIARGCLVHNLQGAGQANTARFTPDDSLIVIGNSTGEVILFDMQDWQCHESRNLALGGIYDVAISEDAKMLAVCTGGGFVVTLDLASLEPTEQWLLPARAANIAFVADGQQIVAMGLDGTAYRLQLGDATIQSGFVSESSLNHLAAIGSQKFATVTAGMAVEIDSLDLARPPKQLIRCQGAASALAVTFSGTTAVGCGDGTVVVRDPSGEQRTVAKFSSAVMALATDEDGLLAALSDGRLLRLDPDANAGWLPMGNALTTASVMLPRHGRVVSLEESGLMQSFDMRTGKLLAEQQAHQAAAWAISSDRGEHLLATVGEDRRLRCWELPDLKLRFEREIGWGVRDVCVAPDGSWVAAAPPARDALGEQEGTIAIWDTATGDCRELLKGHDNWVLKISATADGSKLVTSCENRVTRIWNLDLGKSILTISPQGKSPVTHHAFSSTQSTVFLAHRDGWVTAWNLDDGSSHYSWSAFGDAITGLAIEKDNRIIATCCSSELLRVHDINRVKNVGDFDLGLGYLYHFGLSEDQQLISVASDNRHLLLSRLETGPPKR